MGSSIALPELEGWHPIGLLCPAGGPHPGETGTSTPGGPGARLMRRAGPLMRTGRQWLPRLGLLCCIAAQLPLQQVGGHSGTTRVLSPKQAIHKDWEMYSSPRAATTTYAGLRGNWVQWRARVVLVERRRVREVASHTTACLALPPTVAVHCSGAPHTVTWPSFSLPGCAWYVGVQDDLYILGRGEPSLVGAGQQDW